jgi:hypothetical protein
MPTVYCYPVKLTIADLIHAKSICSQTQFSHIINRLLTSLVRSVLWNIRPLFFACKKPRSDISQYSLQTSRSVNNPLLYIINSFYFEYRSPIRSDYETTLSIRSDMNIFVPKSERIGWDSNRMGFGSDLHTSIILFRNRQIRQITRSLIKSVQQKINH